MTDELVLVFVYAMEGAFVLVLVFQTQVRIVSLLVGLAHEEKGRNYRQRGRGGAVYGLQGRFLVMIFLAEDVGIEEGLQVICRVFGVDKFRIEYFVHIGRLS